VTAVAALLVFLLPILAGAEEIEVVKSGKYYGKVEAYRVDSHYYLGARSAAKLYGAQLYWYAVRGQVRLSFRGKIVAFQAGSKEAGVMGKAFRLPREVLVRASQAFIPVEFFTSKAFSEVSGVDSKFNKKTRLLLIDHHATVGPLRWFSYRDHTRVVLELAEDLRYQASKRGRRGLAITVPRGTIEWSEKTAIEDGVIDAVHLYQEGRQAYLTVSFQEGAGDHRLREFKKPRRLVIDVDRSGEALSQAQRRRSDLEAPGAPARKKAPARRQAVRRDAAPVVTAPVSVAPASKKKRYLISVDAGHGGKDGGAVGRRGTLEKDINLLAAKELAALLEQEGIFRVKQVRGKDVFVRLRDRAKRSNKVTADLFVSIHCNAHSSRAESGYEIYFLSERASDPEAERLAEFENSVLSLEDAGDFEDDTMGVLYALAKTEYINDAAELAGLMTRALGKRVDLRNRGVKQAEFYVLRGVNAPAVLVEMGFLSNARDEAKLESEKYRRKIVEGLYAGIVEYARRKGWDTEKGK